jgi:hypothetical protein
MRRILWVLASVLALWCLWWVAGAQAKKAAIAAWFDGQRAAGWAADYDALSVAGFPLRFDTTLSGVMLADTGAQLVWTLPGLGIAVPSWQPTRVTLTFPPEQRFATPQGALRIGSSGFAGDLALKPGPMLALQRAELAADRLDIAGPEGGAALAGPYARIVRADPAAARYGVAAGAAGLTFDARALRLIDPEGNRPATVTTLRLDMDIAFDAPLDRRSIERARPGIVEIDLHDLTGVWGRLELRAAGQLDVDPDGVPEGLIQVKAVNWRAMLAQARAAGALPEALAGPLERGLDAMAGLAGSPATLDIALTLRGGLVWLGLLPLGPAPRIALR